MNKVILIGNVTRDLELQTTNNGKYNCRFPIAIKRRYKNEKGDFDSDFFSIVTWGTMAENCAKYLKKGSKVAVEGMLQTRTYEKDGVKHYAVDVIARSVEFIDHPTTDNNSKENKNKESLPELTEIDDDGLPF